MNQKLLIQLEEEAEKYERLAKSIRNALKQIRDVEAQPETIKPSATAPAGGQNGLPKSGYAAVKFLVGKTEGQFTIDDLMKKLEEHFPSLKVNRRRVSFVLWKMSKHRELNIIQQGSAHSVGIFTKN